GSSTLRHSSGSSPLGPGVGHETGPSLQATAPARAVAFPLLRPGSRPAVLKSVLLHRRIGLCGDATRAPTGACTQQNGRATFLRRVARPNGSAGAATKRKIPGGQRDSVPLEASSSTKQFASDLPVTTLCCATTPTAQNDAPHLARFSRLSRLL